MELEISVDDGRNKQRHVDTSAETVEAKERMSPAARVMVASNLATLLYEWANKAVGEDMKQKAAIQIHNLLGTAITIQEEDPEADEALNTATTQMLKLGIVENADLQQLTAEARQALD